MILFHIGTSRLSCICIILDKKEDIGYRRKSHWTTKDHHGPSIHSGHYTASINCCKNILLQRSHNYTVWNNWQQKLLYCIPYTIWIEWHIIFGLNKEGGSLIAPMTLPHPLHWEQVEEQAPEHVGWMMCFLLMTFVPVQKLCVNI